MGMPKKKSVIVKPKYEVSKSKGNSNDKNSKTKGNYLIWIVYKIAFNYNCIKLHLITIILFLGKRFNWLECSIQSWKENPI